MSKPADTIASFLVRNIPRSLVMSIEEAMNAGATRAYAAAKGMADGHLPHVVGQLRHFHMNESFHSALSVGGADPSPIKGSGIISGRTGVVKLARFNIPEGVWVNGRRSKTRRQMAVANRSIEPLVQHGLFARYSPPTEAVVFFVSCFSGSIREHPEAPTSVQIAVPNPQMTGWLYRAPLPAFLDAYSTKQTATEDRAMPKLKPHIVNRKVGTGDE